MKNHRGITALMHYPSYCVLFVAWFSYYHWFLLPVAFQVSSQLLGNYPW